MNLNKNLALEELKNEQYFTWNCDSLIDLLVDVYHKEAYENSALIKTQFGSMLPVYGQEFKSLKRIFDQFGQLANELNYHMQKEEMVLFPYIRKLSSAQAVDVSWDVPAFKSVKIPVAVTEMEHKTAGMIQEKLLDLTNSYTAWEGADSNIHALFDQLKMFDLKLHQHVFLENEVLFPKAIQLETQLLRVPEFQEN